MKLLINKNTAEDEIIEVLGYTDATIPYIKFAPELESATDEVISIVGKEIYNKAHDIFLTNYNALPDDNENKTLLRKIRYAIFVQAYFLMCQSTDLAHTSNGRKMRVNDHEKNAFQWMIDADNDAQEKKYYRALDALIVFLNNVTSNDIETIWNSSDAYKKLNKHFIKSVADFEPYFVINSWYLLYKLTPAFNLCVEEEILPRITSERYNELKTATTLNDADKLLINHIKEALANYSLQWAIPRFSINILPDAIVQRFMSDRNNTKSTKTPQFLEPQWAVQEFKNATFSALSKIENLIKKENNVQPNPPKIFSGSKHFNAT